MTLVLGFITLFLIPLTLLVLVWKRKHWSRFRRFVLSLLILLSIPSQLVSYYGLRVELAGTGYTPMISFDTDELRYQRLEEHRTRLRREKSPDPPAAPATERRPSEEAVAPSALDPPPPADESSSATAATTTEGGLAPTEAVEVEAAGAPDTGLSSGELGESTLPPNVDTLSSPPEPPEAWSRFRGPRWDGHYRERPILIDWPSKGPPLLWRQPVGGGYASFVFANGWAFTIEQRRDQEVVVAYDLLSGEERWTSGWQALFTETMGGTGPRSTPTWDAGRLYALGAKGKLRALDALEGTLLWEVDLLKDNDAKNLPWAFAWSPLVVGNTLITLPGGKNGSVVAYHKQSGEKLWSALSDVQAYTSPMLVTLSGREQILTVSRERIMGLEPSDGSLLWEYPWTTQAGVNASQPLLLGDDRVFLSAGYGHGAMLLQIETVPSSEELSARMLWENTNMKNKFTSSVFLDGYIYGLDERILACIDAESGKRVWKGGRYGHGQLLLASEHLLVVTETGELVLVRATPDAHQEIARVPALSGKTWNFPALSDGILLLRNANEMAAFDLRVR